jgi:hypothetical protein
MVDGDIERSPGQTSRDGFVNLSGVHLLITPDLALITHAFDLGEHGLNSPLALSTLLPILLLTIRATSPHIFVTASFST